MYNGLPYHDRIEAGRVLAQYLRQYRDRSDVIVLALPRGGVPVGYEVANQLHVPLDVLVVRKLGVPGHVELGFGAIASGGVRVLNDGLVREVGLSRMVIEEVTERERQEVLQRERRFRGSRPFPGLQGNTVILVDDGLATGATMLAAARTLRQHNPARLVIAVPVGSSHTCNELRWQVDDIICAATPEPFSAVGQWYENFEQTTDEEVHTLLGRSKHLQ
jgi:predicted phosphoribosyltransferase